jgi:hypothetical protein
MNTKSKSPESWWERNKNLHSDVQVIAACLVVLAVLVPLNLSIALEEQEYVKAHHSVFIVCAVGTLYVLLVKPRSMWRSLSRAVRSIIAGVPPEGDDALAALLAALVLVFAAVALAVIDWDAVGRSRGLSAVVAINLTVIARGLWHRYSLVGGEGAVRRKPLRRKGDE